MLRTATVGSDASSVFNAFRNLQALSVLPPTYIPTVYRVPTLSPSIATHTYIPRSRASQTIWVLHKTKATVFPQQHILEAQEKGNTECRKERAGTCILRPPVVRHQGITPTDAPI